MLASNLLNPSDPHPVQEYRAHSVGGRFLLVGDHAGAAIPHVLGDLGLSLEDRQRHIALDLGVEALGKALADRLDAPFVSQAYSRLVVDCNRGPDDSGWIVEESDGTVVPGNLALSGEDRAARRAAIYDPYHSAIGGKLDRLEAACADPVLISLHSFTPIMGGRARPWEIGVLHDGHRDDFALSLLCLLKSSGRVVGDNQPYRMDEIDHTVPFHAFGRSIRYVELEFRQDILFGQIDEIAGQFSELLQLA